MPQIVGIMMARPGSDERADSTMIVRRWDPPSKPAPRTFAPARRRLRVWPWLLAASIAILALAKPISMRDARTIAQSEHLRVEASQLLRELR